MPIARPKAKPKLNPIPVGFKLPAGTRSNAKNLQTPGYVIDQSADPWGTYCKDPWTEFPMPDKVPLFYQALCKRYGQPKPPYPLPEYGQTAMHITDFKAALKMIAEKDPGWFQRRGYGPGPATPKPGEELSPTETEAHDAQLAWNICKEILRYGKELGLGTATA